MFTKALVTKVFTFFFLFAARSWASPPIAPLGTEGLTIYPDKPDLFGRFYVGIKYLGSTASYDNYLYLSCDSLGVPGLDGDDSNDILLFNNNTSNIGRTFQLRFFTGSEIIFRLNCKTTGQNFYTGGAGRNPDGLEHARVQKNYFGENLVSFEDLLGRPEWPNR